MRTNVLAAALSFVLSSVNIATAQNAPPDFAARTEVLSFSSLTLSDKEVLTGNRNGAKVTIGGVLRIARGQEKPPLVILMHGSGGIGSNIEGWERLFLASGISTFAVDSFTGRGLANTGLDQSLMGRLNGVVDIFEALSALKNHPRVDASKIVLMGFSRGGQYVLQASQSRLNNIWNTSGIVPAAYVTLYAACGTRYRYETERLAKPILMFHGTADDYVDPKPCRDFAMRLKADGANIQFIDVPDAHHAYDILLAPINAKPNPQTQTTNCALIEGPEGVIINTETNEPFGYRDSCVKRGATVAYSPSGTKATYDAVREFLKEKLFQAK